MPLTSRAQRSATGSADTAAGGRPRGGRSGYPRIVELVGPAGVGKTTLLRALGRRDPSLRAGMRLPKYLHAPTTIALLPTYLALHWPPRRLLLPEMKRVTYLQTLWRALDRAPAGVHRGIVLDEGPVYFHARALVYGGRRVRSPGFERWWRGSVQAWVGVLDGVVWLDAPDAVLAARIQRRSSEGQPGAHSAGSAAPYRLAAYRRAYERVLADLAAAGGPSVMRIDTSRCDVEEIVKRVLTRGPLAADA